MGVAPSFLEVVITAIAFSICCTGFICVQGEVLGEMTTGFVVGVAEVFLLFCAEVGMVKTLVAVGKGI
eukprot:1481324-Ditylum_brightwellii.AAC.1